MGLQTQSPQGMVEAIPQRERAIRCLLGAIHRLQEEMLELKLLKA